MRIPNFGDYIKLIRNLPKFGATRSVIKHLGICEIL